MNDSLIKDIGRSYIVSSLLPASFFVLLAVFIFRDFLPPLTDFISQISGQQQEPTIIISSSILLLAFVMWVAFMLYSSVDFVVKLYEGYHFPFFIKKPLQLYQYFRQYWRLRGYFLFQLLKEKQLPAAQDENKKQEIKKKVKRLRETARMQVMEHELSGPLIDNWNIFLPTSLGNILLASELYPYEKYRLNGAMLFPRMSMTFPPEFVSAFEEKNNQLMFILNSSFLSYLIGLVSLLLGLVQKIDFSRWPAFFVNISSNYLAPGYKTVPENHYLLIGITFILAGYIIYRISIHTVKEYALFVRTSFDMYRFRVLEGLNLAVPKSLKEERLKWQKLSDFLVEGDRFGEINFDYEPKSGKELTPNKEYAPE